MSEYTEHKLLTVALGVIQQNQGISTSDLIDEVIYVLEADGVDLTNNPSRNDSKISQKIRNLKSHGTLEAAGAIYNNGTWTI